MGSELPCRGALAVTVPGAAALWEDTIKAFGKLPLAEVGHVFWGVIKQCGSHACLQRTPALQHPSVWLRHPCGGAREPGP